MLKQGGLLTEYMSQTEALPNNFRQRNRIVAGISDATILVESAIKGGGLITCRIAQEYGRDVFAFPGAVGMPYSEGCNKMIRNNTAALITSAADFLENMGWQTVQQKPETVERQLFPDLTLEEQQVVSLLQQTNDLQPISAYFLGFFKKSIISTNSCFSSSQPATSLNVTVFCLASLALDFAKSNAPPAPPWLFKILLKIKNTGIAIIKYGKIEIKIDKK